LWGMEIGSAPSFVVVMIGALLLGIGVTYVV
jgi:hypothetical protein